MNAAFRIAAGLVLIVVIAIGLHVSDVDADGASPSLANKAGPAVLLIGDSYTEGPTTPDLSYGCLMATELEWECNVAAQPGTGYVNGGPGHRIQIGELTVPSTSLVERLPRLRELHRADVVILDAGRNDVQFDMTEVMRAFSETLMQVIRTWPNSRVVVIAPWFVNEPVIRPPGLAGRTVGDEFRLLLRSSPDFAAVDLIDPGALGWFVGTDVSLYVSDDGIHPNAEGVTRIADLLTAALVSEGVASPS
jgi:lysophospholipase L1-like esterase